MGLHRSDLGDGVDDRALDLLRNLGGLVEREVGSSRWSEISTSPPSETMLRLWISRLAARTSRRRARSRSATPFAPRLDVDDDVAAGERLFELRLDAVRDGVALTHCRAGGAQTTTSANFCPAAWRRRSGESEICGSMPAIAARAASASVGRPIHQDVDVPPDQPAGGEEHERGNEERCDRAPPRIAGRRGGAGPASTASVPAKSLPKRIDSSARPHCRSGGPCAARRRCA